MAKQSSQKFIQRNRAPRVQIEYDVETYGAQKKVQIPFVMGVLVNSTWVIGLFEGNYVLAVERGRRLWRIRTRHVVLATGAIERPPVFPDNDRPGTMLAGAGSVPTIHGVPNRSTHMPNIGDHDVGPIGWRTSPPSASSSKTRVASIVVVTDR